MMYTNTCIKAHNLIHKTFQPGSWPSALNNGRRRHVPSIRTYCATGCHLESQPRHLEAAYGHKEGIAELFLTAPVTFFGTLALPIPRGRRKFARIEGKNRGRECTIHTHGVLKLGTAEPNVAHGRTF